MKYPLLILSVVFFSGILQAQQVIPLWSKKQMPNSKGLKIKDSIANERQYVVANPNIEVYTPSKEENRNFAVLVIPGGGYARLAHVVSGSQLAKYINTLGGTAFVLKYRLPNSPDLKQREIGPLQDGQRAIKMIRALAPQYNIDPHKVGVFGTSAGGHLASSLGVNTDDYTEVKDTVYKYSFTPDFMILLSPVITLADPFAHKGSRENLLDKNASKEMIDRFSTHLHVTEKTPPTLLMHANDDTAVPSLNSVFFYTALREKGINASLHIFPHGKHAIALTHNPISTQLWMPVLDSWLKELGY
ncbi:alpha/beta hydrolase [Parabacteroides sp. FAFU027]|uniref:alpha/beta hydrolase n=1 Tax=Parabacteroides sp. FAFU027 TaxID=2922715 RepID=UPI001FB0233A|nr:alpha/beta hydrolase [Parabacteroides sp. FAFU027]